MAEKQIVLTEEGLRKLEEELNYLKSVRRKEIAESIKTALSFGDLSENAEYDEAKNDQALLEVRISELEETLKNVRLVDTSEIDHSRVNLGSIVTLYDKEFDEELVYTIVSSMEVNPAEGKISEDSPIGSALIGHGVGETVACETPGGRMELEIRGIERAN